MADVIDKVEVVYPLEKYQRIFTVELNGQDLTILEAISQSGILEYYPEIDLSVNQVGINSEIKALSEKVKAFDRVEIYRPLIIDPMAARRLRAARQKA
ncbi:MAG: RnfH family protein [Gammaproteobacteria bacterium]|nr:RnfH family protein [Gammaproteobacteria bacterium]